MRYTFYLSRRKNLICLTEFKASANPVRHMRQRALFPFGYVHAEALLAIILGKGISINFIRSESNADGECEEFFADVRPLSALGNANYKTAAIVTAPDPAGQERKK